MSRDLAGDGFVLDLLQAMPDEASRRALRRVLTRWVGCRPYIRRDRGQAGRIAAQAMASAVAAGLERAEAVRRLSVRLGCSVSHARRLLRQTRA